ncbi:MAG: transposase [Bacteriovoracaceae bacterium]
MSKQQTFSFISSTRLTHGGELARGKRKSERPLKMNKPLHIVLRAKRSTLKTKERKIQNLLKKYAERFNIKIYRVSVNSNHLHLLIVVKRRMHFQHFLRSITGLIARLMGAGKLWEYLAFSRVSDWGKQYRILMQYIQKNVLEASGFISFYLRSG